MNKAYDHAGVYVPPPLIIAAIYLVAWLLQEYFPISTNLFMRLPSTLIAPLLVGAGMMVGVSGAFRFVKNKTTILAHKPVAFLQTGGIYAYTRNPMYTGLLLAYTGFGFWPGNWWVIFLLPAAIWIMTRFVIQKEERYLHRAFGKTYDEYCKKVRRWI